jgi:Zn-dependent oligopeptidase
MAKYDSDFLKINETLLSEYFPAEHIKEKTMEIYQELLGLEFKKIEGAKAWH